MGARAVNLINKLFKVKVPVTRLDALEFRNERLQALVDNFTEVLVHIDAESTPVELIRFTSADYGVEEDDGFVHEQEFNEAVFKNNHWHITLTADLDSNAGNDQEQLSFRVSQDDRRIFVRGQPLPPAYKNLPELELGAEGIVQAIKLAAKGRNLLAERLQRQAHAQGLAELNAHMGRKGLALPLGVLGDTYSFLEPIRPHPEPGHAKRRSAAKSLTARERQERLTSNQMEFLESLSPEDRESAYAMLGGKRSKRSKRSKRTRGRSARKGTRSRK